MPGTRVKARPDESMQKYLVRVRGEYQRKERERIAQRGEEITAQCSEKLNKDWDGGREGKCGDLAPLLGHSGGGGEVVGAPLLTFHSGTRQ